MLFDEETNIRVPPWKGRRQMPMTSHLCNYQTNSDINRKTGIFSLLTTVTTKVLARTSSVVRWGNIRLIYSTALEGSVTNAYDQSFVQLSDEQ